MSAWRTRALTEADLDDVLRVWETTEPSGAVPGLSVAELVGTLRDGHPGVIATVGNEVVGAAIAQRAADRAWIQRIAISEPWRHRGIAKDLLTVLEGLLEAAGVRRFSVLIADGDADETAARQLFAYAGYASTNRVTFMEKAAMPVPANAALLEQVGGSHLPEGLWERIGGMDDVKRIIERRVILPVQEAELAAQLGVQPPKAILLFGPPGTGKTSFARGVASRLRWPLVEIHPSDLQASTTAGEDLRQAFGTIRALDSCVVFLDEVEDIAAVRTDPASRGLTNDLLKVIPAFRHGRHRLLICATNDLDAVDPAFHRPGRFDCLIPVGLPDTTARQSIWEVYIPGNIAGIDLVALAEQSEGFTPADIAHCAATAAHRAFERALSGGPRAVATTDYLEAIGHHTATTSPDTIRAFRSQAERDQRW